MGWLGGEYVRVSDESVLGRERQWPLAVGAAGGHATPEVPSFMRPCSNPAA